MEVVTKDQYQPSKTRKTKPYMSDYEYCALISARAVQLTSRFEGIAPKIKLESPKDYDPMYIAMREINEKLVDLVVRRHLPDNTTEDFMVKEMILPKI
jgi:DNA-directed RNA polymerase subunit K/omega